MSLAVAMKSGWRDTTYVGEVMAYRVSRTVRHVVLRRLGGYCGITSARCIE